MFRPSGKSNKYLCSDSEMSVQISEDWPILKYVFKSSRVWNNGRSIADLPLTTVARLQNYREIEHGVSPVTSLLQFFADFD